MVRFFRKMGTSPVPIPGGKSVPFTSLDQVRGYFATDSPDLCAVFETCMAQNRSAITEIDEATFNAEYMEPKKNGQILKAPYREEISRGKLLPSASDVTERLKAIQHVVGVANPPPPVYVPPVPAALIQPSATIPVAAEPPAKEEYVPVVGKRKRTNAKS